MFASRFLLVSILCFLLLSPYLKSIFNKLEKPVIVIAQDNSSSILMNKDSLFYQTEYLQKLENLKLELSKNYEVKQFTFSDQFEEGKPVDFKGKITNISNVFKQIKNKFYNRNIGAVILATDGIYNEDANPIYTSNTDGVPIYSIALGDTIAQKDIILKDIIINKFTFLGNKFPLEINAQVTEGKGEETKLKVEHNGKVLFEKLIKISSSEFNINENLLMDATTVGNQKYTVTLSQIKDEISIINNVKDVFIEVLDGRQEVLLLASAPHPDLKALKLSIESNENYKVNTTMINDFGGNFSPFNLVIVHQLHENHEILNKLQNTNKSVWYVLDAKSNISMFNNFDIGVNINNSNGQLNQVLSSVNIQFPLFTLSDNATKYFNNTTPLIGPFGTYNQDKNGYTLLYQKIGAVETNSPLLAFYQSDNKKNAVLFGEGIWRWRIQEYNKTKKHEAINELVNKTIQFLSIKEDKSKFRLIVKNKFLENEEVVFNCELYNESYELNNEPEVTLKIINDKNEEFNYVFNKTANAYFINSGYFSPGLYTYEAKVSFGEKKYIEKGEFQVEEIQIEANNTRANHQLLKNFVSKFGGRLFTPQNMGLIAEEVENNSNITSILFEEKDIKELINLKWIFGLLILLLSLEWFLRKRNGAY